MVRGMATGALQGQVAFITGAGSGLGAAFARRLAADGAEIVVNDLDPDAAAAVASEVGGTPVAFDVTDSAAFDAAVDTTVDRTGRLDVLVNNAGNMYRGPLDELREDELLAVFHSNVVAAMMLTQTALPHLRDSRGAVVFIGSVHSQRAFPGASPYAATKGAVETLTGVLAAELGPTGVRVSCVRPGGVLTEINQRAGLFDDDTARERLEGLAPAHALGRIGTVDEIAEAVEYLVRAEWTTGSVLTVDGGLSLGVTNA